MTATIDLTGQTFNHWVVLARVVSKTNRGNRTKNRHVLCRCDCGNLSVVKKENLKSGQSTKCYTCGHKASNKTHGLSKTYLASTFQGMKQRCNDPKTNNYKWYGGKGIKCLLSSPQALLDEIGHRPTPKHTVDRIDTNGHYVAGNIKWATGPEQARNTSSNVLITFNGKTQCLADWSDELAINYSTLHCRLTRRGWSIERALTTPSPLPVEQLLTIDPVPSDLACPVLTHQR